VERRRKKTKGKERELRKKVRDRIDGRKVVRRKKESEGECRIEKKA
jgi:hypothetical protein